jgi:hypothetical protein
VTFRRPSVSRGADLRARFGHARDVPSERPQLAGLVRRTVAQVDLGHADVALVGAGQCGKDARARAAVPEAGQGRRSRGARDARRRDLDPRELTIQLAASFSEQIASTSTKPIERPARMALIMPILSAGALRA